MLGGGHQSTSGPGFRLDGGSHRPCMRINGCWPPHFSVEGGGPTTTTNDGENIKILSGEIVPYEDCSNEWQIPG